MGQGARGKGNGVRGQRAKGKGVMGQGARGKGNGVGQGVKGNG